MRQKEMTFLGEVRPPRPLRDDEYEWIVSQSKPMRAAIVMMIERGRYRHNERALAEALGLVRSHLSMIKTGKRHPDPDLLEAMQALTGISAIDDYRDRKRGLRLVDEDTWQKLQFLRGAAAA